MYGVVSVVCRWAGFAVPVAWWPVSCVGGWGAETGVAVRGMWSCCTLSMLETALYLLGLD